MYKILVDGDPIHISTPGNDRYNVLSPKLYSELNMADTLTFELPPGHPRYNSISTLSSTITVYDDENVIFHGRCTGSQLGLYKTKVITCEGALAWLHDSILWPITYYGTNENYFNLLVNSHNTQVPANRRLVARFNNYVGEAQDYANTEYISMYDALRPRWWETGATPQGYLVARYEDEGEDGIVSYLEAGTGQDNDYNITIRLGRNILDLNEYIDASGVYSRIYPIGAKVNDVYTTIASVNSGLDYLDDDLTVAVVGAIAKVVNFPDIDDPAVLKSKGSLTLAENIAANRSLEVAAIITPDMLPTPGARVKLGWNYHIISEAHNIDEWIQCTRIELDMENPGRNRYMFGNLRKTISAWGD